MTPRVRREDLRDHAVEARVDRVWERLEGSLAMERGRLPARNGSYRMTAAVAAALLVGFVAGVGSSTWTAQGNGPSALAERTVEGTPPEPGVVTTPAASPAAREAESTEVPNAPRRDAGAPRPATASRARTRAAHDGGAEMAPAASQAAWVLACTNDDYERAVELAEGEGGLAAALTNATNEQRLCLASGSRLRNQPDVAKLALQRVADDSDDPDRSAVAAAQLAQIYEDEGNGAEQRRYEELKEIRSKGRLLSESALCEKIQVQAGVGAHRTVLELARQYENQYPSGTCTATVAALVERARAKLAEAPAAEPALDSSVVD